MREGANIAVTAETTPAKKPARVGSMRRGEEEGERNGRRVKMGALLVEMVWNQGVM